MEYKCINCTFYRKNIYEDQPPSVTFFGTEKQVSQARTKYSNDTGYNVDETYNIEVEPEKLQKLKKLYIKNNKKTIIL
tara:strand:- start:2207 stop:2440 length:234 start_codon:yes stop_codon:yes gene_type:complete